MCLSSFMSTCPEPLGSKTWNASGRKVHEGINMVSRQVDKICKTMFFGPSACACSCKRLPLQDLRILPFQAKGGVAPTVLQLNISLRVHVSSAHVHLLYYILCYNLSNDIRHLACIYIYIHIYVCVCTFIYLHTSCVGYVFIHYQVILHKAVAEVSK